MHNPGPMLCLGRGPTHDGSSWASYSNWAAEGLRRPDESDYRTHGQRDDDMQ